MHGGDAFLLQQRGHEGFVVRNRRAAPAGLANAAVNGREDIEGAFGRRAVQARCLVEHSDNQVPPLPIDRYHLRDEALVAVQCFDRRGLGDAAGIRGRLALQLVHCLDQCHRTAAEADAPAGHGIGLAATIHGQRAVLKLRLNLGEGGGFEAVIDQLLIDIVGHHPNVWMPQQHIGDRTIGNVDLATVQDIVVAVAARSRAHRAQRIRARARFGEAQRADRAACA